MAAAKDYALIVFDMDGTLFDFAHSELAALEYAVSVVGLDFSRDLVTVFRANQDTLWQRHLEGALTLHEFYWRRFLSIGGSHEKAEECNMQYLAALASETRLLPGAVNCVQHADQQTSVCVVTEGDLATQTSRLADSELADFVPRILTAEQVGFAKPDPKFFEAILEFCSYQSGKVLMVGDEFTADIEGAHAMGWDTCWLRKEVDAIAVSMKPTYIAADLDEVRSLLS